VPCLRCADSDLNVSRAKSTSLHRDSRLGLEDAAALDKRRSLDRKSQPLICDGCEWNQATGKLSKITERRTTKKQRRATTVDRPSENVACQNHNHIHDVSISTGGDVSSDANLAARNGNARVSKRFRSFFSSSVLERLRQSARFNGRRQYDFAHEQQPPRRNGDEIGQELTAINAGLNTNIHEESNAIIVNRLPPHSVTDVVKLFDDADNKCGDDEELRHFTEDKDSGKASTSEAIVSSNATDNPGVAIVERRASVVMGNRRSLITSFTTNTSDCSLRSDDFMLDSQAEEEQSDSPLIGLNLSTPVRLVNMAAPPYDSCQTVLPYRHARVFPELRRRCTSEPRLDRACVSLCQTAGASVLSRGKETLVGTGFTDLSCCTIRREAFSNTHLAR